MTATMLKHPSGLSCPPRYGTPRNPDRPTLGPHVAKLAAAMGRPPMPWQRYVLDVAMELGPDGNLWYQEVVVTIERQAGKTTLILPVFTHRCVADFPGGLLQDGPQPQAVYYTAQTRNDARKKWVQDFIPVLDRSPLRRQYHTRMTNGSEGFDWSNGSTFDLMATMEKSGHGGVIDAAFLDEIFAHQDFRMDQAVIPAQATRRSPQRWKVSTAGSNPEASPYLWASVEAGRERCESGEPSRVAYFEWSFAPDDDPRDPAVWRMRHPAIGHTITEAVLQTALDSMEFPEFCRSFGNMWNTIAARSEAKLPTEAWTATAKLKVAESNRLRDRPGPVLTFDVDLDSGTASTAVATGSIGDPYVQMLDHKERVDWLPARLVELVQSRNPVTVGYNAAGPALEQIGRIQVAFREAGISADLLCPLNASEYRAACGGFYADVIEGRLKRPEGQQSLGLAGEDATERTLGEGWVWDRRQATIPISPLVAVTCARFLLPTELTTVDAAANVW